MIDPGDIWYFPRGHGHMLECLGDQPCHFVLIFDNGYFSEFGTFSISDWIGHTPAPLLAKNFNLPVATFDGFPTQEVYFAQGVRPPVPPAAPLAGRGFRPRRTGPASLHGRRRVNSAAAGPGCSMPGASQFRRRLPARCSRLNAEPCGSCTGTPMRTSGSTCFRVGPVSPCSAREGGGGLRRWHKATWATFPQGYGHSIENVGDTTLRILVALNSGDYQEIDLAQWMAGNPVDVLATNFGRPAATFRNFPTREAFIE